VRRWWETDHLCEIEQIYFDAIRTSPSVLDVGAGDLRIMGKLKRAGYAGDYHTQDVGTEGAYTYRDLDEIRRSYGAILCLDVIEHLALREGLTLIRKMISLLQGGGVLVLQTPNASYIPDPRSLTCEGLDTTAYRVVLRDPNPGPIVSTRMAITAYVKRRVLGCDYANNIAVIARKALGPASGL